MMNISNDLDETLTVDCLVLDNIEACASLLPYENNFKLLTFNIRSLQHNFDSFLVTLKRVNIDLDIIILTECWLSESSLIPQISGYYSYRTFKHINKSGGVTAYVKDTLNANVSEPLFEDCNCLEIKIGTDFMVLGIYRSPSFLDIDPFLLSLNNALKNASKIPNIILAGDLNIDIYPMVLDDKSSDYVTLLTEYQLLPAITKPTREKTCLDHIFIKRPNQAIGLICPPTLTDHSACILGMTVKKSKTTRKRFYQKIDIDAVASDLSPVDWTAVTDSDNVDNAVAIFSDIIDMAIKKNTREIKISRTRFTLKPWITPGLIKCLRQKDRLHLRARCEPLNQIAQITYKRYRNFLNTLLLKLKTNYENEQLTKNRDNPKMLWNSIKDICHLNETRKLPFDLLNAKSDPKTSLNHCNNYFVNVGKNLATKTLNKLRETQASLASKVKMNKSTLKSFYMNPTDENEVSNIILDLKPDSSPGLDKCTPLLIKLIRESILKPLTHIFNLSLASGIFPSSWKLAIISPIHKNGEKDNPCNYRPISLLIIFSKLLEKLVHKRITTYLEDNGLIPNRQYGFRRGKSTEDAVILVNNIVSAALDSNKHCIGVFLDLAKAFDTVSIPILLEKLSCLGIRGKPHEWFQSYLSTRFQCVRVGHEMSEQLPVEFGVPQGSILDPRLFLIT